MTVRELYSITAEEAIGGIATSHVMATLDDHIKKQVQVLVSRKYTSRETSRELTGVSGQLIVGKSFAIECSIDGKKTAVLVTQPLVLTSRLQQKRCRKTKEKDLVG